MIERYADKDIARIWSDENKLKLWQKTELAVIEAMAEIEQIDKEVYQKISKILESQPIDLNWWQAKDAEIKHDLNAFVEERLRFLPPELQPYFHRKITSYDDEEPAFATMLKESIALVEKYYQELEATLVEMAKKYRFTIMLGRTHGQGAALQSFGKRILTWLKVLRFDLDNLKRESENLKYSKISGAIGNYESIEPELEKKALKILGFEPYYGAIQTMPREIYAPIAQALCQIVLTLDKIALDIRLGARSGRPIYQEPFGKKQKGSSAMPHKKNTISTEQMEGMGRMAKGFENMIKENIKTWEERAIEQSCVERVAWPDLFHIVIHSLKTMTRVLKGLVVYPDNMLWEIIESRGCYASSEAKEVLRQLGVQYGLTTEDAYRIIQLAAFNAFEPSDAIKRIRTNLPSSLTEADEALKDMAWHQEPKPTSIRWIISEGYLKTSPQLDITEGEVQKWNAILKQIFSQADNLEKWNQIFQPSYLLKNEAKLYQEIIGT
jgi:adenylosuccinate lyase